VDGTFLGGGKEDWERRPLGAGEDGKGSKNVKKERQVTWWALGKRSVRSQKWIQGFREHIADGGGKG